MATAYLYYEPRARPLSSTTLTVIPNATLTFYFSGTTNLAPIYATSSTTGAQLANPISADGSGLFPVIYVDPNVTYRTILKDVNGVTKEDTDPAVEYQPIVSQAQTTIASAGLTDLGTAGSNNVFITGTTTINSFGASASTNNPIYYVRFASVLTLTQSSNLQLPGGANIATQANDTAIAEYFGTGTWQILSYNRSGAATSASYSQLTVGAPASGVALTVNSALGSPAIAVTGSASSSNVLQLTAGSAGGAGVTYIDSVNSWVAGGGLLTPGLWSVYDFTRSVEVFKVNTTGNFTVNSPVSGATITANTTAGTVFRGTDGTVLLDAQINSSTGYLGTASNHALAFITNNTTKTTLGTGGNWVFAAPTSQDTLYVNGFVTTNGRTITTDVASATSENLISMRLNAVTKVYMGLVGTAGNMINGSAQNNYIIRVEGSDFLLSTNSGFSAALKVTAGGLFTFAAPSGGGGPTATINAAAAQAALVVNGSASTPVNNIGNSSTAFTVDCSKSNVHAVTMTGNVPAATGMTISNMQDGQTINLYITQDATGSRTLGNATGVKWSGGVVGVLSTAANSLDMITFQKQNSIITATIIKAFA
jgi:hypothetical protein